jgi:hypothetical protein
MQSLPLKTGCLLVAVLLLLCSVISVTSAWSADRHLLWQSRDQFVALESQDSNRDGQPSPNGHPADISPGRLAAILASIDVRMNDRDKVEPLFTDQSLEALVPQLQQALRQAGPGEDVTFAIIGLHRSLFGFAKSPKVTAGRVFVSKGGLNIIFGMVQEDVNEREDRRLVPFLPGSRTKIASGDWKLFPHSDVEGFTPVRNDWLAFSSDWKPPVVAIPAAEPKKEVVPSVTETAPQGRAAVGNPADRLTILNELKNKGLITDEEYRTKRLEILNGL